MEGRGLGDDGKNCRDWRRHRGSVGFSDVVPSSWDFGNISPFILGFRDALFILAAWGYFSLHLQSLGIFLSSSWASGMLSLHPVGLGIFLPSSRGSGMLSLPPGILLKEEGCCAVPEHAGYL